MTRVIGPKGRSSHVGPYIRGSREESGLRLQDLSDRVGVPLSYLSAIERGDIESPAPDRLVKIAVALGEDPDEMLVRAGYLPEALWRLATVNPRALAVALRALAVNTHHLSDFDGEFNLIIANPPYARSFGSVQPPRDEAGVTASLVARERAEKALATPRPRRSRKSR